MLLYKDYHVIIRELARITSREQVEVAELLYVTTLAALGYELLIYHGEHARIVNGAVMIEVAEPEMLRHCVELVVPASRDERTAECERIEAVRAEAETVTLVYRADK